MVVALALRAHAAVETVLLTEFRQLPLWSPVMLGAGIGCYFLLPWREQWFVAVTLMAMLVALGFAMRGIVARVLVFAGVLMLAGFGLAWTRTLSVAAPRLTSPSIVQLVGTVTAVELRTGHGQSRLRIAPYDPALPPDIRVSVADSAVAPAVAAELRPGARVSMTARLAPPPGPTQPGGYDFARHAWFEGFGATGNALGGVTILESAPPPGDFAARLATLRAALTAHLKLMVPGVAGSFAAAFVTGEKGAIPEDVAQAMRDSGLAHLLSISGLHIAIVVAGMLWGVRKLLLLWPWLALRIPVKAIAAAVAAITGIGYTLLAGSGVPTVRACLATLIVLIGITIGREAISLRLVATAAFVILLFRPEALLGPSFQLSFAAVTGLIALYQSRFGRWLNAAQAYDGWLVRLLRTALALLVTGLVAEAMLSATALYHFNRTGLYGVVANLVAIPLTTFVIMPLQVLALGMDAFGIGAPVYWLLGHSYILLIDWAKTVAHWPGAVVRMPSMSMTAYGLFIAGGLWLCLWHSRLRIAAIVPIVVGIALAVSAQPPDILVSADGRQVALRIDGNRLARLHARQAGFVTTSWITASAATGSVRLSTLPGARCSASGCALSMVTKGRTTIVLVARAAHPPQPAKLEAACRAVDIVISERPLPPDCQPRRLRIDRVSLQKTQALAIWLSPARMQTVAGQIGDHPWQPAPSAP